MKYDGSFESKKKDFLMHPTVSRTPKLNNKIEIIEKNEQEKLPSVKSNDFFNMPQEQIFKRFEDFTRDILNIFDGLINEIPIRSSIQNISISQTDRDVIVDAEIPGVSMNDLDVNIYEGYIRLSGKQEISNEFRSLDNSSYRGEKCCSSFLKTIPLPAKVKYNLAKVEHNGESLRISIPKFNH